MVLEMEMLVILMEIMVMTCKHKSSHPPPFLFFESSRLTLKTLQRYNFESYFYQGQGYRGGQDMDHKNQVHSEWSQGGPKARVIMVVQQQNAEVSWISPSSKSGRQ